MSATDKVFHDKFKNLISRHNPLTAQEEQILSKKIQAGCLESREKLVLSNLRLAVKKSKKYADYNTEPYYDILISLYIAIWDAAGKFQTSRVRFSTYAEKFIQSELVRTISNFTQNPYTQSERQRDLYNKIQRTVREYFVNHGEDASSGYIADKLSLSIDLVELYLKASKPYLSQEAISATTDKWTGHELQKVDDLTALNDEEINAQIYVKKVHKYF